MNLGWIGALPDPLGIIVFLILGYPVPFILALVVLYIIARYAFRWSVLVSLLMSVIIGPLAFFAGISFF
ncbi:hypothetical protein AB4Y96_19830 [Phyllobacterium sp. TAF24]|uniref:hypothetical protein n=1 Tax=Phyllobacterium sp. TAF24 TaxID=3233068 RepID=UPI003F97FC7A